MEHMTSRPSNITIAMTVMATIERQMTSTMSAASSGMLAEHGANATALVPYARGPPCQFTPTAVKIVLICVFFTIFCLSVVGNSVVLVIIVQQRWMRTVTNLYLLNLAVSDLLLIVICMPPTLTGLLLSCFVFPAAFCPIIAFLQPVSVTASAYTLTLIAVERYYAICRPLHSRHWQTKSHALKMIACVWLLSFTVNTPVLFLMESVEMATGGWNCRAKYATADNHGSVMVVYNLYVALVLYALPICVMVVLYARVIRTLRVSMDAGVMSTTPSVRAHGVANGSVRGGQRDGSLLRQVQQLGAQVHRRFSRTPTTADVDDGRAMLPMKPFVSFDTSVESTRKRDGDRERSLPLSADAESNSSSPTKHKSSLPAVARTSTAEPHEGRFTLRSTHTERSLASKKRVIQMLCAVVIEFFIFWTPLYTALAQSHMMRIWFDRSMLWPFNTRHMYPICLVMAYTSTCCNPITYCFLNEKFRHAFLYAFGCGAYVDRLRAKRQANNTNVSCAAPTYNKTTHMPSSRSGGAGANAFKSTLCPSPARARPTLMPPVVGHSTSSANNNGTLPVVVEEASVVKDGRGAGAVLDRETVCPIARCETYNSPMGTPVT